MAAPTPRKPGYVWNGKKWVKRPERTAEKVSVEKSQKEASVSRVQGKAKNKSVKYPGGEYRPMSEKTSTKLTGRSGAYTKAEASVRKAASVKPKAAPKTSPSSSSSATTKPAPSTKPKAKASNPKAAVGGSAAPISQSDTRWVHKPGQRGYVEQISTGKRVTGKVTLVENTTKGKAGQTRVYKGGKDVTKGKK